MDEDLRILEEQFCPPLDPALVRVIYSDYAEQDNAVSRTRGTLEQFKDSAIAEQLTDFDPSGSSGGPVQQGLNKEDAESNPDAWATQTTSTDRTNLSNTLSSLSLGENSSSGSEDWEQGTYQGTAQCNTQTKELRLAETFPNLRIDLIRHTLQKSDNDFNKAIDILLNQAYFEDARSSPNEDEPVVKGIDAFSEDYHVPHRGRKGKSRKKQRNAQSMDDGYLNLEVPPAEPTNRWLNNNQDIEFIASRTNLPAKNITSLHRDNNFSLPSTIAALIQKSRKAHEKDGEPDAAHVQDAMILTGDFPTLDLADALDLIRLTTPSTANAHELAKAFLRNDRQVPSRKGGIQISLQYAPVNLAEGTEPSRLPTLSPTAWTRDSTSLSQARGVAFQNASAAFRKGKSTPLMRQAAAYYAQEGRDLSAHIHSARAADADALVSRQSSATHVDLHGVTVANATRIAGERTRSWWDNLGEQRIPEWGGGGKRGSASAHGFRIVTGLGRHSEGGRGKIGPAVFKALVREGWKVEVGTGELVVTGLMRRN